MNNKIGKKKSKKSQVIVRVLPGGKDGENIYEVVQNKESSKAKMFEELMKGNAEEEEDQTPEEPVKKINNIPVEIMNELQGKSNLWFFNAERMNLRRNEDGQLVFTNRPENEELAMNDNDREIEEIEEFEEEDDYEENEEDKDESKESIDILESKNKIENDENEIIDYDRYEINPNVKMKKFDQYGIPWEKRNLYKDLIVTSDQLQGEIVFQADIKETPVYNPSIDYKPQEMTEEQKEVFEALNYEGEDEIYQPLVDNFVELATEGEPVFIDKKKIKKENKERKKQVKIKEIELAKKKNPQSVAENKKKAAVEEDIDEWEDEEDEKNLNDFPAEKNPPKSDITSEKFNSVINDHMRNIAKKSLTKNTSKQLNAKKPAAKAKIEEDNSEEDEESDNDEINEEKEDEDIYAKNVIKVDYFNPDNNVVYKYGELIHTKTVHRQLKFEEDIAMQQVMNENDNSSESNKEDEEELNNNEEDTRQTSELGDENFDKKKALQMLHIVKEDITNKKVLQNKEPIGNGKKIKYEKKNIKEESHIPIKPKNETKEEKAARKKKIKELKQEKKNKKKQFKEQFEQAKKNALHCNAKQLKEHGNSVSIHHL